jgi:hypothetical protein
VRALECGDVVMPPTSVGADKGAPRRPRFAVALGAPRFGGGHKRAHSDDSCRLPHDMMRLGTWQRLRK